jgi:hypothetical protein
MAKPDKMDYQSILHILHSGDLILKGEFVWGSNYSFLAQVTLDGNTLMGVYKPTRGERPLWDFPETSLARREAAAFIVSQALGWELVPPTVSRQEAPMGPGSLQLFIDHDPEYHYFNLSAADHQRLRPVALFDILVNNADRKGGHIIFDQDQHIWLIDHGICFHEEPKLRTVIWDFAGEKLPAELTADLIIFQRKLIEDRALNNDLQSLLSQAEIAALAARADTLVQSGCFPKLPSNQRPIPWPPI